MVIICPQCRAKSRVNGARAQQPGAKVRCGGCQAIFYAAQAKLDREGIDARTAAALARARQSTGLKTRTGRWQRLASPLALVALFVLMGFAVLDPGPDVGPSEDLTAQVQVAPPAPGAQVVIEHIEAMAYAPTGGPEGLLVRGTVRNGGAKSVPMPSVLLNSTGAGSSVGQARLTPGPERVLEGARSLAPDADETAANKQGSEKVTLAAGAAAPFVGLLPALPSEGRVLQVGARLQ